MTKPNGHDDKTKVTIFPSKKELRVLEKARIVHPPRPAGEAMFNLPPVVQALCLINIGVFLLGKIFPQLLTPELLYTLAFVPARYFGGAEFGVAGVVSPITHMFIHMGWLHVGVNVAMLAAFGSGLEKNIGGRRMLLFYFACGLCGALVHALAYAEAAAPMIGASGAISGLFGGILMMMYAQGAMGQGTRTLLPLILVWIGISVFFGVFGMPGVDNPIAWTTHIGGFIAGLLLYKPVSRLKF